jgi:hypothetical protein
VSDEPEPSTRLATQLLLLGRNPATGRLVHPRVLDIGLRAALFSELILQGRMVSRDGAPFVFGETEHGDHILDSVARAVHKRQNVQWWRWYRHVRADRQILIKELLDSGRWTQRRGMPFPRYDDTDELAPQARAARLDAIVRGNGEITDAREGTLAVLTVMCGTRGRPNPRALRKDLKPLVDRIVATAEPNAEHVPSALAGASVLMRKPTRR